MKEKGHTGGALATIPPPRSAIELLTSIEGLLKFDRAIDMPADGEDYRDLAISAGAGDVYLDSDVQFGYAYIPNCPRDVTIYSGTRGGLIGSFKAGSFIQFRMPRTTGITIAYGAGVAAQTLTVYLSAREIFVKPGEVLINPGTAAGSLGKIEDTPHATGDVGVQALAVRNDSLSTIMTSANGDYSSIATDDRGGVFASAAAGVSAGDVNSNTLGFFRLGSNASGLGTSAGFGYDGNDNWTRLRTPVVFKAFNLTASSAEQTIWTPAAGKKFRLMGFVLTINTLAATVTFRDNTAGTTIFVTAGPAASVIAPSNMGNGILSAANNNRLTIQASAVSALVGTVWGTEE